MKEFKRLVSYIYSYPGGVKDKNVGFAKAEVRNGIFGLSVNLMGVYRDTPEGFSIYLIFDRTKKQGTYNLLPVGSVIINGGKGRYQDIFNPDNIASSGYTFSQIKGIGVLKPDDNYYSCFSLWEADEITPSKCVYLPKGYVIKEEKNDVPEEPEVYEESAFPEESEVHEAPVMAEEPVVAEASDMPPASELSDVPVMPKVSEASDMPAASDVPESPSQSGPVFVPVSNFEKKKETLLDPAALNSVSDKLSEKTSATLKAIQKQQPENQNLHDASDLDFKIDFAEKLFLHADYINAFDDDYYYDCIEVTPEMLKRFVPGELTDNNSFMMHGFYTYRHLLFGRVAANTNGTRYFIGIPGMYSNKERYLATMFGFNSFKKSHRSDYPNPYFGYWYAEI